MRDILAAAEAGEPDSELAVRAFCYRAKKYVGAYLSILGGADAVIFGGGIGENLPKIREGICAGFEWAGLQLDPTENTVVLRSDAKISGAGSAIEAWVVQVDEAAVIACDVIERLRNDGTEGPE